MLRLRLNAVALVVLGSLPACEPVVVEPPDPPALPDQAGCTAAKPDKVLSDGKGLVTAPDGRYGQASCPHSFVVDNTAIRSQEFMPSVHVSFAGPEPQDEASCQGEWLKASVWQRRGTSYVKIDELEVRGGTWLYIPPSKRPPGGYFCSRLSWDLHLPAQGEYRIAASAGTPSAGYAPVQIWFDDIYNPLCPQGPGTIGPESCTAEYASPCSGTFPGHYGCAPSSGFADCVPDVAVCISTQCHLGCGACSGEACTVDGDCALGLVCDATKRCSADPDCTLNRDLCWQADNPPLNHCL